MSIDTNTQKELYKTASDYWYRLHEDYRPRKTFISEFTTYLDTEKRLIQSLDERQKLDNSSPIGFDLINGQNVAFAIISAISACSEFYPKDLEDERNDLLMLVIHAFSTPSFAPVWDDLCEGIERINKSILKKKEAF